MTDPKQQSNELYAALSEHLPDSRSGSVLSVGKKANAFDIENPLDESEIDIDQYQMIRRRATRISDGDYFKQDNSRSNSTTSSLVKSQSTINMMYGELEEVFIDFNTVVFIKTFLYHFLYFSVLGPLVIPIICVIDSWKFAQNLEFATFSRTSFMQLLMFFTHAGSFYIFFATKRCEVSIAAGLGLMSSLIFRCAIVALKYSFINREKIEILKKHYVPMSLRTKDHIMPGWTTQGFENVYKELRESVKRHEIDDALFHFEFLNSTDCKCESELFKANDVIVKTLVETDLVKLEKYQDKKYHGLSILYFFIQKYNQALKRQQTVSMLISLVISLVMFIFPYVIKIGDFYKITFNFKFQGMDNYDVTGFILHFFPTLFFSTLDYFFILLMLVDSHRVKYLMQSITAMMTTKDSESNFVGCSNPHLINFFDVPSLKTWSYLRRVAIDYGKYFRKRVEYASVIFTVYSLMVVGYLVVLYFIGQQATYKVINVMTVLKLAILVVILLVTFISSAHINQSYLSQKAACQEIRNTLNYLARFKSYYFEGEKKDDSFSGMAEKLKLEYRKYQQRHPERTLQEYTEELIETLKDVMYEIEFDFHYNTFKVLGVKAEVNLFKRVVLAIASFVLSSTIKFILANRQAASA